MVFRVGSLSFIIVAITFVTTVIITIVQKLLCLTVIDEHIFNSVIFFNYHVNVRFVSTQNKLPYFKQSLWCIIQPNISVPSTQLTTCPLQTACFHSEHETAPTVAQTPDLLYFFYKFDTLKTELYSHSYLFTNI